MITLLLVAAALAFLFWPRNASGPVALPPIPATPTPAAPPPPSVIATKNPRRAIDALLEVRDTLSTSDPESTKAIDKLWLDLLHTGEPKK